LLDEVKVESYDNDLSIDCFKFKTLETKSKAELLRSLSDVNDDPVAEVNLFLNFKVSEVLGI